MNSFHFNNLLFKNVQMYLISAFIKIKIFLLQLTNIPMLKYSAASAIGLSPTAVLNCYMGSTLRSMEDVLSDGSSATTGYIIFAIQVNILTS